MQVEYWIARVILPRTLSPRLGGGEDKQTSHKLFCSMLYRTAQPLRLV
jgi:hypothetical protein